MLRLRKAGVENLADRDVDGVLLRRFWSGLSWRGVLTDPKRDSLRGVAFSGRRCVRLAGGVVRESTSEARRLDGVNPADSVGLEGVLPRRSKSPRTRPSFCGVGPIEVGRAGLKSFREVEGVAAVRAVPGVLASTAWWEWAFLGVWKVLDRLDGVVGGSSGATIGGGILPEMMSRSLLYCLYLWAMSGLCLISLRPGLLPLCAAAQSDSHFFSSARTWSDCASYSAFVWSSMAWWEELKADMVYGVKRWVTRSDWNVQYLFVSLRYLEIRRVQTRFQFTEQLGPRPRITTADPLTALQVRTVE